MARSEKAFSLKPRTCGETQPHLRNRDPSRVRYMWRLMLAFTALAILAVTGCSSQATTGGKDVYPLLYQTATEQYQTPDTGLDGPGELKPELEQKFSNFTQLFAKFKHEDMRPRIEAVYAEKLYFNDTLHTFNSREVMLRYMQSTADRVDFTDVEIKDIVQSGDDYYVRWAMDTGFTVFGKQIKTHSIGMTHIRFDEGGLINFHQDFWDNTEGFFRHLPVIGFLINKTKQRL